MDACVARTASRSRVLPFRLYLATLSVGAVEGWVQTAIVVGATLGVSCGETSRNAASAQTTGDGSGGASATTASATSLGTATSANTGSGGTATATSGGGAADGSGGSAGAPSFASGGAAGAPECELNALEFLGNRPTSFVAPAGPPSSEADHVILLASDLSEAFGQPLRFVGVSRGGTLFAETRDSGASVALVFKEYPDSGDYSDVWAYGLPAAQQDFRLVDTDDTGHFLGCSWERCALFEVVDPMTPTLRMLENSEFSGGPSYTRLYRVDQRFCADGADAAALCFDGSSFSDEAGTPIDPFAIEPAPPPADADCRPPAVDPLSQFQNAPIRCTEDSEVNEELVRWMAIYSRLAAATAEGRMVRGSYNPDTGLAEFCVYATAPLGPPVSVLMASCGAAYNPQLVTHEAFYGPTQCYIF